MLNSGERQVAPTIDGIRADHVARYGFVAQREHGKNVIDAACGVGYGAKILATSGNNVTAYDNDEEAIAYAKAHYNSLSIEYIRADLSNDIDFGAADAAVCFETIEHLRNPKPLLRSLRKSCHRLYASVPNESVFPHNGDIKFHYRHYTTEQFDALLKETGWHVKNWHMQRDAESVVTDDSEPGRTIVAECIAGAVIAPFAIEQETDHGAIPETVTILGLGPSVDQFVDIAKRSGGARVLTDEVWGINSLGDVIHCDRIFHMDDVRIQKIRADAQPESNIANMLKWMRTSKTRIYTSRPHPDYPNTVGYPIEAVLNKLGFDYFNSTAAWAVAYAIYLGVKKIRLFGCDFTYANSHDAEKGRACVEFWLGYAAARGIKISLPKTTSLMDACHTRQERLYGYDTVIVELDTNTMPYTVKFTEAKNLPTAEEIENRYDHSAHPNPLVNR